MFSVGSLARPLAVVGMVVASLLVAVTVDSSQTVELAAVAVPVPTAPSPAAPPVTNCYPLNSLICSIPVNVGPFGPFNVNLPNGLFGPPSP
jgi:hypothetical protein